MKKAFEVKHLSRRKKGINRETLSSGERKERREKDGRRILEEGKSPKVKRKENNGKYVLL